MKPRPNAAPPREELRRLLYLRDWDGIYDQGWDPVTIGRMGGGIPDAINRLKRIAVERGDFNRLGEIEQQEREHEKMVAEHKAISERRAEAGRKGGLARMRAPVVRRTETGRFESDPKDNPFYLLFKPEGRDIERLGPMSEADFWIEDAGPADLVPLVTSADPTYEEIGQLLRDRRHELNLRIKDVAVMAGLSTSSVHDIEKANRRAGIPSLNAVARALGAYFEGPLPKRNPNQDIFEEIDEDHYRMFHGVSPDEVLEMQSVWVPGGMVFIGTGKDVGYGITNPDSFKDGWYVHDFGSGVKIYRRPRQGERADKTWRGFPSQLTNLGWNLGFTYNDGGPDGPMKEVKGSRSKYLAVTPNRKMLVVIDGVGVLYLMEGGSMRVDDWIRD